jgi:hypothetical protein
MTTESLPAAADANHLTDVLRSAGMLHDGRVCDVAVESSQTYGTSQVTRLRLSYLGASNAPSNLILKTAHPDRAGAAWDAGHREVEFYAKVAIGMPALAVPRCFEAHWDAGTNAWHILLEDLSETHVIASPWPLPPTMRQCESIMRARARCHAAWWNDPRLRVTVGSPLAPEAVTRNLQDFGEKFAHFADRIGNSLPRERRKLFERLLDAGPRLAARYVAGGNLTLLQGDSHVWNCFLPRDAASDDVRLFDWDSWRIGIAASDLAYMMALHWYPDLRREREKRLLDEYHATLVARGVTGYDRRALDDDYRLSVLWHMATPVWQAAYDVPPWVWWNNLERVLLAVDDLGCQDLLF